MAAAALWGYPRAPCPLRIWGVYLMVGPSAMELTPSSWLFPDLLPLRVLESSKTAIDPVVVLGHYQRPLVSHWLARALAIYTRWLTN